MAPTNSADVITGSSEAWASLVVNIAPLLILVGERHVKDYFKSMHGRSQRILFAAAPIGLVTALTTLLRLRGTPFMKRLIGRQSEKAEEMFMDVTGLSHGEVEMDLNCGRLEQVLASTKKNDTTQTRFFVHGKCTGTVQEVFEYADCCLRREGLDAPTIIDPKEASWNSVSTRTESSTVLGMCIRVLGKDSEELANEAVNSYIPVGCTLECTRRAGYTPCSSRPPLDSSRFTTFLRSPKTERSRFQAIALSCSTIDGVSHILTANLHHDNIHPWKPYVRYLLAVVCIAMNGAIIALDWETSDRHSPSSTALIIGGLLLSILGSWLITEIHSRVVVHRIHNIGRLRPSHVGYTTQYTRTSEFSTDTEDLGFVPSQVVIAAHVSPEEHDSDWRLGKQWHTGFVLVATVVGYLAFYLGLRNSEWWLSLSFLAVAAVGSIARVSLLPDRPPNELSRFEYKANPYDSLFFPLFENKLAMDHRSYGLGKRFPRLLFSEFPSQGCDLSSHWQSSQKNSQEAFHEIIWFEEKCLGTSDNRSFIYLVPQPTLLDRWSNDSVSMLLLSAILRGFLAIRRRNLTHVTEGWSATKHCGSTAGIVNHGTGRNTELPHFVLRTEVFANRDIHGLPLSVRVREQKPDYNCRDRNLRGVIFLLNLWFWRLCAPEFQSRMKVLFGNPPDDPTQQLETATIKTSINIIPRNMELRNEHEITYMQLTGRTPWSIGSSRNDDEALRRLQEGDLQVRYKLELILSYVWMGIRIALIQLAHWSTYEIEAALQNLARENSEAASIPLLRDKEAEQFVENLLFAGLLRVTKGRELREDTNSGAR